MRRTPRSRMVLLLIMTTLTMLICGVCPADVSSTFTVPNRYFAIEIVDEQTGRGVPLVELQTTYGARYYTDSAGRIAFYEPGLMNQRVFFSVAAHGYEFPADGLGLRGVALETRPGGKTTLKIKRLNIAERLYRITGQGIYRDSILLGEKPPIAQPLLNAEVTGQDSVLTAIYHGKTYWLYGDTNRLSYGLGNFATAGATSVLPDKINPAVGINLTYFVGADGFAKPMAPMDGPGVVWLSGLVVVPDDAGQARMLAFFQRRQGLGEVLENGFVEFDDQIEQFRKVKTIPVEPPIVPSGPPLRVSGADGAYVYFATPFPTLRVRAERAAYLNLADYEGYTCLKTGARYLGAEQTVLDRDTNGKLLWAWKKNTSPLSPKEQQELIRAHKMTPNETPFRPQDGEKFIVLHNGSCQWNDYRKKYVVIATELLGATVLGEIWYSEADRPEGPWTIARKIITHANKPGDAHDFYNPVQHAFLDEKNGRVIYLEGTYVNTFSGNSHPTPYYEYNQILYRLDLTDSRLNLPPQTN